MKMPKYVFMIVNDFYTYIFLDPRKPGKFKYSNVDTTFLFEPFYVGKGRKSRYKCHFAPCNMWFNTHKTSKIRNIKKEGLDIPVIKYQTNLEEVAALLQETFLIRNIGRFDLQLGPLTNKSDGGLEQNNFGLERREQISKANKGRKWSVERKALFSINRTGVKKSQEHIQSMSIGRQGKNNPGARTYIFKSPTGIEYLCRGEFKKFTERHNLDYSALRFTLTANRAIKWGKCKGWQASYNDIIEKGA